MKRYIIIALLSIFYGTSYGQVGIGKYLNQIREEDSTGTLEMNPKGEGYIYIYDNKSISSKFIYFLNYKWLCYATSVKPYTKESKKYWINGLKEDADWVKVKPKFWEIDLGNNLFVECSQIKDIEKDDVFIFIIKTK